MKPFLKKTGLFIVAVAGFMIMLLLLQDPEFIVGRKKIYVEQNGNKNFDYLVLGSSRAMYTFNPTLYTGNLRLFNMGEEGQGFPSNYLMMKMLVEKHHVIVHNILLQVDEFSFNGSRGFSRKFRDDFFVTDIDDDEVYDAFKRYRGTAFATTLRYFPKSANLMYSDLSHFVKHQLLSLKPFVPRFRRAYEKGITDAAKSQGYKYIKPNKNIPIIDQHLILEEDDMYYFLKLMEFCKAHHINVYFYRAPILECRRVHSAPYDHFIDSFTRANNIPYFDYKCDYQLPGEYYDQNHPATKVSTALTKDLLDKLGL